MPIGEIDDTCVVLATMNQEINKDLGDGIVRMPGFDESRKKRIDFDGIDLIEEEEIHFVTTKHSDHSERTDKLVCDSCERSNDPQNDECDYCGESLDVAEKEHNVVLDNLNNYMESKYPDTHVKSCKVLYGNRIDRLSEYIEDVEADFLALHEDYIEDVQDFSSQLPVPIVILG